MTYVFEQFHLDRRERRLVKDGVLVPLEPKSFDLLCFLAENSGRLVTKQEIVDAVWSRTSVSDNSLTRCVHQVRSALSDHADRPRIIETVPGSGYRFIAKVTTEAGPNARAAMGRKAVWKRLRPTAVAALIAAAVAVTLSAWWLGRPPVATIDRVAVLPLDNLTGDPNQAAFVQSAHEALIAELSRRTSLDVISRTSVLPFGNTNLGVPEIAKRLNVDAVIEGSVARTGENLILTAQLIAADPERHLWAGRFARNADSLFEINTELENQGAGTFVGPANIAIIYGALGDRERAFSKLEKAYELRDQILTHAENAAYFDPLRADARFLTLRNKALATTVPAR